MLRLAIVEAGFGHLFADAAFLDEVLFEAAALLVEEVVGLVDEADGDVGEDFRWAGVHEGAVGVEALVGRAAQLADVEGFFAVLVPDGVIADAEVILVVEEEFFEAGAGDVDELQLGFGGSDGGFAAFGDVLFSGSGGLHHLVDGAVPPAEEAVGEAEGEVVDDLSLLVGDEVIVVAGFGEEAGMGFVVRGRRGHGGRRRGIGLRGPM